MTAPKFPAYFLELLEGVQQKRARTVIDHILKHGQITTQEIKDTYGYNHPPRAARDVREHGIPLETFKVTGADGRHIAAYRFGDPALARRGVLYGRTAFGSSLKAALVERFGARCHLYCTSFPERELQIDHRIPFEIAGDAAGDEQAHPVDACYAGRRTVRNPGVVSTAPIGKRKRPLCVVPAIGRIRRSTNT